MEGINREDLERLMFFEQAREQAEREFKANNKDAMALTKWGGALLELAHFRQGGEAYEMIEEAIGKFEAALALDANRHDALWCLGNAYTSQGFLSAETSSANEYFERAGECFRRAVDLEPANDSYKRALEMSGKAPQLYQELQRQLQAASAGGSPRVEPRGAASPKEKPLISDFWYDVAGWACLVGLVFGVAAMSRGGAASGPAAA
ncbi:mitochondrial import receptor subunit TOM20 [Micractinium conductrix]|uniref:Mitochondrial import receptor subunit TOM20 n=1 Tax=Micractinium conductrix TaxID=554055 RepID=A0A2P6V6M6_9CHLO|nr:mitochondrial import receptor subunit TOM20 [Micractinium conductrix]|eukprot:PSC69743.1 mitochondrial import receptor subunit TOM20 [Micractinium conductrix]